jgi:hypothetical protein
LQLWNDLRKDKPRRRKLIFDGVVAVLAGLALAWVYTERLSPLSDSPQTQPSAMSIAWAGQQLRGYTEWADISAPSCTRPAKVVLTLNPAPASPHSSTGRVALVVAGDQKLSSTGVRILEVPNTYPSLTERLMHERTVTGTTPLSLTRTAYFSGKQGHGPLSMRAFVGDWIPISRPIVYVVLEDANWLSERTSEASCWLRIPELVGSGPASYRANAEIGHPEWDTKERGEPLREGVVRLNYFGGSSSLRVVPTNSIPAPASLEPAKWPCASPGLAGGNCQAFADLETPGREAARAHNLARWSLFAGVLLAIAVGAGVGFLRNLVTGGGSDDTE